MLKGLRTVGFDVDDVGAAKEWYAELLGKRPYFDEPFYVGFDVGGYELGLHPKGEDGQPGVGGDVAYWAVDDVSKAVEDLVARGAKVHRPAQDVGGGIVVASVVDPFGNAVGLIANPHFAPPLVAALDGGVSERAVVKTVVVPAPVNEVFALWSSSEGLAAWWLPGSRVELRPGGFFELYFMEDAPAGKKGSEGCRILSFVPDRMLSFTWNAPPHLDRTRERYTWVVVELEPDDAGTLLRLTHLGWPAGEWETEPQWQETYAYFDAAWQTVMDLFARHFASGDTSP